MMPHIYKSTKQYGHEMGLSCCFRQWKASSHCRYLHGYALAVRFIFEAEELDERNWVVDFGSLKTMKAWLESVFDHTLIVAQDDPKRHILLALAEHDIAKVVFVERVGCETFAKLIFDYTESWLTINGYTPRCTLRSVEVKEHGSNSALYERQ